MVTTRTLKLPTTYAIALSRQGNRLATIGRNVTIFDPIARRRIAWSHPISHPSYACFSGDGRRLAVKNTSGRIVIIDSSTASVVADFANERDGEGAEILYADNDQMLLDANWGGTITVRDAVSGRVERQFTFPGDMVTQASSSSDRSRWLFLHQPKATPGASRSGAPYLTYWKWPLDRGDVIKLDLDSVESASLAPDGTVLVAAGWRRTSNTNCVQLIDVSGGVQREVEATDYCRTLSWSACGTRIGHVCTSNIVVHDTSDLATLKSYAFKYAAAVAFAIDLSFIALGGWEGGVVEPLDA